MCDGCAKDARAGKARREAGEDQDFVPDGVEGSCGGLGPPSRPTRRAPPMPGSWIVVHLLEGAAEGSGMEERIGVEQDQVATRAGFEGKIVGCAKAEIDLAAQ